MREKDGGRRTEDGGRRAEGGGRDLFALLKESES
jgi:hypothetical protein